MPGRASLKGALIESSSSCAELMRVRSLWRAFLWAALPPVAVVLGIGLTELIRGRAYAGEHIDIDGIGNAGRVSAHLYRGAQPSPAGIRSLKALGVQRVVSLTLGSDDVGWERA